jgi:integrase
MMCYKKFIKSKLSIPQYLIRCKDKRNNLAMLRILYPEQTKGLKFPKRTFKPKFLPNKEQLRIFYNALPEQYKPLFLLLGESGLRPGELIDFDVDRINKMLIPKAHNGSTKYSWVSFYCTEFDSIPKFTVNGLGHVFKKVSKKTGVSINPHHYL